MSVKELLQSEDCGKEVEVKGWVRTKRGNKQVNFIALNDGSTINNIQVVVDMEKVAEEVMKKVTTGAAVHVKGVLVESTGSGQAREIQAKEVIVTGEADPEKYPIQPKKHSLEFLREVAHLRSARIFSGLFSVFVTRWLLPFINILTIMGSIIYTPVDHGFGLRGSG